MESHVLWVPWTGAGLEHLHLLEDDAGVVADGVVMSGADVPPFRLWYQLRAERDWTLRDCVLQLIGGKSQALHLRTDGAGHWIDAAGAALSALDGCLEIDLSISPFTNTLPIRRLALHPGQSADLLVAYITLPDLAVGPVKQRYTCLEHTTEGGLYRYEGLESGFTAHLRVDAQGVVQDYPGLWERVRNPSGFTASHGPLDGLFAEGPAPELADQLQLFGQFVGEWECAWTGYPPDGPIQTGTGEIRFAWVLEGRAIQDVWIFPAREERRRLGLPSDEYGTTLRFYDASIEAWRVTWIGPVGQHVRTLTARQIGDEIVVEGTDHHGLPLRWIFSRITNQAFHWRNTVSEDGGHTWRVQEELEARRLNQRQ
jgi:uncharacterized protein